MPELLVELLSEEIPARMQARAAEELGRLLTTALTEAGLTFERAETFATPRRLALVVDGLPERQPDRTEEKKGPRIGAPEQAIQGFLRSAGLSTVSQCEKRAIGKAEFWVAVARREGRQTVELIPGIVTDLISDLAWPKSMRWADGTMRWVRPLHGVLCVFNGRLVPHEFVISHDVLKNVSKAPARTTAFSAETVGHRFLAPGPFAVRDFADYKEKLRAAFVILDPEERKRMIAEQADRLAAGAGLKLKNDPALLEEVAGLVEWPVALMGRIDDAFLDLPPEVLTTSMRTHQRYFTLEDAQGRLAPRFIVVANLPASDGGAAIVAGNERVLRARLADAKYFWDQDRKVRLEDRVPRLDQIVFHARLGTMGERVARLQTLAAELAERIPGCDRDLARSAALLAKADLVTGMVGEFPELQGIMGRYYALAEGERPEVADAIAEHYAPKGPDDRVPSAPVSVAVALAEKIDTLVGMFAIGEKPTDPKDPYALRRAALGVLRLILDNSFRIHLAELFGIARQNVLPHVRHSLLPTSSPAAGGPIRPASGEIGDTAVTIHERRFGRADVDKDAVAVVDFVFDRLVVHLRDAGVPHDHVRAIFGLDDSDDLVQIVARVRALGEFLKSEDGANLLVAYRRAANIVRIEEKKDGASYSGADYDPSLAKAEEAGLWQALSDLEAELPPLLEAERFTQAMSALARLRRPVDSFFDKVTVNVEDAALRRNRLRLLARIAAVMNRLADFSRIEG